MKRYTATIASLALIAAATLPTLAAEVKDAPGIKAGTSKSTAEPAYNGTGTVKSVDAKAGKINIAHGPIPSLNWPAMTMDFQVKNNAVLKGVAPGQNVEFDIVQQGPGQFIITRIAPAMKKISLATPAEGGDKCCGK